MMINQILPSYRTASMIGTAVAAPVVIEMALRIFKDLYSIATEENNKDAKRSLSAHMGGAAFYGLCALNLVPGTAIVGAAFFTAHAFMLDDHKELTSWAMKKLGTLAYDHVIEPVWTQIVQPVAQRIYNFILTVLEHIHLPRHPVWYGVALLATAIWFKYGYDIPALMNDLRARIQL
jgi:hypothetical protein